MFVRKIFLACLLCCIWAVSAQAHALLAEQVQQSHAITVRFAYSGGDKAAYTAVEVYSPADAAVEYQNGRADKNGTFSFVPNASGEWLVVMSDGMGHKVRFPVLVALEEGKAGQQAAPVAEASIFSGSVLLRVLLGISLFAALFCCAGWRRAVRRNKAV